MNDEVWMPIEERHHDIWFRNDESQKYVIVIMYRTNDTEPRFVTSSAMSSDKVLPKVEAMLNDFDNKRMVCLNAHFINPANIISIKVDLYKERKGSDF